MSSETHDTDSAALPNGDLSSEVESNGLADAETVSHDQETESVSGMSHVESKEEMFVDANEDMQENQFQEIDTDNGTQEDDDLSVVKGFMEERVNFYFSKEVANLRLQLKALADKESLVGDDGVQEEAVATNDNGVREMIMECSRLVEAASEERERNEITINELGAQIEELRGKVQVEQNVEYVADRMLASLGTVVIQEELLDYSVMGKMAHLERSSSLLIEQYRWILYEMEQLRQCLSEVGSNMVAQEEYGYLSVLPTARGELIELKRKEVETLEKFSRLEDENRKLVEEVEKEKALTENLNAELGKVKAELDQEKNRCANTKEKLSMAVTKGKALVQQRDSLKQSLAEKTSEIEKCSEERSRALEAAEVCKDELTKCEGLLASLQETLSQKNAILETFEEIFSQTSVPEELQSVDAVGRLRWLVNLVSSLQKKLSEKVTIIENLEGLLFQANVPEELKSADVNERLKWLVNLVGSQQEILSERVDILGKIETMFSQISTPVELQSADTIEKLKWFVEERNTVLADLLEFHKLKDALSSIELPQTVSSSELETRLDWLKDSARQAKYEIDRLQDDVARIEEAAHNEINRLSAAFLAELQEKEYIKTELDDLASKYEEVVEKAHQASAEKDQMVRMLLEGSGTLTDSFEEAYQINSDPTLLISRCLGKIKEQTEDSSGTSPVAAESFEKLQSLVYVKDQELMLCKELLEEDVLVLSEVNKLSNELRITSLELSSLKEEKETLQKDLERSEEKSALVREKLSLAVKKGKGLVQDRENLKLLLEEKNSEIEKLKLDLQKQETTVTECRDQINKLSSELEQIAKLEADLISMKRERDQLQRLLLDSKSMLQRVLESVDRIVLPVESVFEEPVEKINCLAGYMDECQQAKTKAQKELEKFKDEVNMLRITLSEAQQSIKSLENSLSFAENQISQLADEKKEVEVAREKLEQELQGARDEASAEHDKLVEAWEARKSLEDALSLAESNISLLVKEREEAQVSRVAVENELEKVREEVATQTSKLTEAYKTVKSLEDELSQAEVNISSLTELNNHVQAGSSNLESEIKKLKDEVESWTGKVADASTTIKSLEEQLSKTVNDVSVLEDEKKIAEHEISTLNSKLKACMDELAGTTGSLESRSMELLNHLSDLQIFMKDEGLLSTVRKHFEKEFENLKDMDIVLKDIWEHFADAGSELMLNHAPVKEDAHVIKPFPSDFGIVDAEIKNDKLNTADADSVSLYFKKTADEFQLRNKILAEKFGGFSVFMHELIEAVLTKLRATKDAVMITFERMESMKQEMRIMELQKEDLGKTIATLQNSNMVLRSACVNATRELHLEVKNSLLELSSIPELAKLNHVLSPEGGEVGANDIEPQQMLEESESIKIGQNLLMVATRAQSLTKLFESTSDAAASIIGDLQNKLRGNSETSEKAIGEKALIQNRVSELEAEVESLQTSCKLLKLKIEDYQALEDKLHEKETELSDLHATIEDLQNRLRDNKEAFGKAVEEKALIQDRVSELEAEVESLQTSYEELRLKMDDYQALEGKLHEKEAERSDLRSTIEDLQNKLMDHKETYERAIEEKALILNRVSELEAEVESFQSSSKEMRLKLEDYRSLEDKLLEKEVELSDLHDELSKRGKEEEVCLMSKSQLKTLFDKLQRVEIPFAQLEMADGERYSSTDVKKLFYIVDGVTKLHNQIKVLSHEKDELQSTLSTRILEIEQMEEEIGTYMRNEHGFETLETEISEISSGLQKICHVLGSNEIVGDEKPYSPLRILPALEKNIMALLLEAESSKSQSEELQTKLLGSQKLVDELSARVKLLEDSLQSRNGQPEIVQERSIFEAPSLPSGSEISEIEDVGPVGKKTIPPVPSAAHVRTMRKGSTDHLALDVDLESASLINSEQSDEDKGHMFKSLNTSGLIPKQGKLVADRIDGIWVSGSRVLMNRPRARLGLIAYWLVLHIWLLGTIL